MVAESLHFAIFPKTGQKWIISGWSFVCVWVCIFDFVIEFDWQLIWCPGIAFGRKRARGTQYGVAHCSWCASIIWNLSLTSLAHCSVWVGWCLRWCSLENLSDHWRGLITARPRQITVGGYCSSCWQWIWSTRKTSFIEDIYAENGRCVCASGDSCQPISGTTVRCTASRCDYEDIIFPIKTCFQRKYAFCVHGKWALNNTNNFWRDTA